MTHPTTADLIPAIPLPPPLQPFQPLCQAFLQQLLPLLLQFGSQQPTPQAMHQFEIDLHDQLRRFGQGLVQRAVHQFESSGPQQPPPRLRFAGACYRRRRQHPNAIATLFGTITLRRYLYEACEPGEPSLHPLEVSLGVEAGNATPALAERVGCWAAQHPQAEVLRLLLQEHGIAWSVTTLRKVTASLSEGLAAHRQAAQQAKVLGWLAQAQHGRGPLRPVLAVGRDGAHLPIRGGGYQEGATATVSVYDRRGRRRGTVYLGQMPQEGQHALSEQLTALVTAVLAACSGPLPRLAYVTDGGHHPKEYYRGVLCRLQDPRHPGRRLSWAWVLDYYHASSYVSQLAEALFGPGREAERWAGRMRHWLKHRRGGVANVLRSASMHEGRRRMSRAVAKAYGKAYRYVRRHGRHMDYASYRRQGLPIGSGVTEAACKTVFTQRLKQSGMSWEIAGGQVIVDLRVILRSGVWREVNRAYRASREQPVTASYQGSSEEVVENAA
ncbi:MAG TPA: hypothetical protein VHI93_04920 [Candidatus Thermoplasmatota archaeon]|nr:hypothetical protein [Candidatus Thermoplasmatota archaeon]